MKLYRKLSQISFLKKSYAYKFLFIAFVGIHVPLIGLLFFILFGKDYVSPESIVFFTLIMTLLATGFTLLALKRLIQPIELASKALDNYRSLKIVPQLPTSFKDEAGLLLSNIQESIVENEKYNNDKQDLIYLLSHDLRNFVTNSQGLASLILDENPSENVQEYSNLIFETTNQQLAFIETFIKLIKSEDEISKKTLQPRKIELPLILDAVTNELSQKLISKNIKLKTFVSVDEVLMIIDDELLIRVLVNLVDNAIKFSFQESEIQMRVSVMNDNVVFRVVDSGIGFDDIRKEALFSKFTKASRLGTANEPSTGIGLYLCKKIVEKYRGEIHAESKGINQGATFSVTL